MKICTKCKQTLDYSMFNKNKATKDGYQCNCKACVKKYHQSNKDMINATRRKNYNKEKNSIQSLGYYYRNREKLLKKVKEYQSTDEFKNRRKKYYRNYKKQRLINDNLFLLKENISCLIRNSINRDFVKNSKTIDILGCSIEEFKIHLEKQFLPNMTWDNRSEWHIDHIIPVSSATNKEEIVRLNHFTNLRPLWAKDNLAKGRKVETLL